MIKSREVAASQRLFAAFWDRAIPRLKSAVITQPARAIRFMHRG